MKKIITIFFILLSFSAYSINIDELTKKADSGDVDAQSELGYMYYYGDGTEKNRTKGLEYYTLAAEQGDIYASRQLWIISLEELETKADSGDIEAQLTLADMHYYGETEGIEQDYIKALKYYKLAAEQGYKNAEFNLGVMYQYGKGTRQDLTLAKEWYKKSCDNGLSVACEEYERLEKAQ